MGTSEHYQPITSKQRLKWFVGSTLGPRSLVAGVFTSAVATAQDSPPEYGPHWGGFGERYGMRLMGIATENGMEAQLGDLWGEDPRYFRSQNRSVSGRARHIFKMTFMAYRPDGHLAPAYARFFGISGSNFLSNSWRVDSDSSTGDALRRTGWGFLGRMGSNALEEFWPDIRKHIFHRQ